MEIIHAHWRIVKMAVENFLCKSGKFSTALRSLASFKAVLDLPEQKIRDILADHTVSGAIDLPKDYGMFICR